MNGGGVTGLGTVSERDRHGRVSPVWTRPLILVTHKEK